MSQPSWMIYGAYGYTGRLLAEEAKRRGHAPILAGRSASKLQPLAAELGLPSRVVDLDDPAALEQALDGLQLVLHAAGPFVRTSEPMIRACLARGVNYLDVTGEVHVFANTFGHDAAARQRGIVLMSGVGFDVVPTDCLAAYVASKVPGANELEIAIAGLQQLSAGTAKSMVEGGLEGCLVRRNGKLVSTPHGQGSRDVRFVHGTRTAMPIPWGDLETAYHSTGIPNITTYMVFPPALVAATRATSALTQASLPLLRRLFAAPLVKNALESALARVQGPAEQQRSQNRCNVWASARAVGGEHYEAWLQTADGYTFTALAGVRCVERVLQEKPIGALTPSRAFGADFVLEIEGTQRYDALPA